MNRFLFVACASVLSARSTNAFSPSFAITRTHKTSLAQVSFRTPQLNAENNEGGGSKPVIDAPAPSFNGKMVLPMRVIMGGLKGHKVTAVYAIYSDQYKRGEEGWESCELVGITQDLETTLKSHLNQRSGQIVAYVRALSYTNPPMILMEETARQWHASVRAAEGNAVPITFVDGDDLRDQQRISDASMYLFDDDDEDDDEDEEWDTVNLNDYKTDQEKEREIISPFSESSAKADKEKVLLEFTSENVDAVLEQVRPYLIQDGGNVAIQKVDTETRSVYLILEGACGSCPSSTITMQMGIERTLRENFADLGEVVAVSDEGDEKPTELTMEMVEAEVGRLTPAIFAMGGTLEIVGVDPIGVVEIRFRGANKVQHGLELALRDIPLVKHVKFVS